MRLMAEDRRMQSRSELDGPSVSRTIRVVAVDDHPVLLRGLVQILAHEADLVVAATAAGIAEAVDRAMTVSPDVIILPWRLEGRATGHELVRVLGSLSPARLIIYTGFVPGVDMPAQSVAGATLVAKTADPAELLSTIRGTTRATPVSPTADPLTVREREVLHLLLRGLSNAEIASLMTIELSTVKSHVRAVLRKLHVTSRRDLIGPAVRHR